MAASKANLGKDLDMVVSSLVTLRTRLLSRPGNFVNIQRAAETAVADGYYPGQAVYLASSQLTAAGHPALLMLLAYHREYQKIQSRHGLVCSFSESGKIVSREQLIRQYTARLFLNPAKNQALAEANRRNL